MFYAISYEGAFATSAIGLRPSIFRSIHVMYICVKSLPVRTKTYGSALLGAQPDLADGFTFILRAVWVHLGGGVSLRWTLEATRGGASRAQNRTKNGQEIETKLNRFWNRF